MKHVVNMELHLLYSSNPTPAADQIDSDEDSDGAQSRRSRKAASAGNAELQTPPNSFVDPSAFKQAFEKHYQEMQHKFLADKAAPPPASTAAGAEGRPLQEALRAMRAGIPGQQQRQQTSASTASQNQGGLQRIVVVNSSTLHNITRPKQKIKWLLK